VKLLQATFLSRPSFRSRGRQRRLGKRVETFCLFDDAVNTGGVPERRLAGRRGGGGRDVAGEVEQRFLGRRECG